MDSINVGCEVLHPSAPEKAPTRRDTPQNDGKDISHFIKDDMKRNKNWT